MTKSVKSDKFEDLAEVMKSNIFYWKSFFIHFHYHKPFDDFVGFSYFQLDMKNLVMFVVGHFHFFHICFEQKMLDFSVFGHF